MEILRVTPVKVTIGSFTESIDPDMLGEDIQAVVEKIERSRYKDGTINALLKIRNDISLGVFYNDDNVLWIIDYFSELSSYPSWDTATKDRLIDQRGDLLTEIPILKGMLPSVE